MPLAVFLSADTPAGSERTLECGAETAADCHVVKIVLRTMNIRFSVSGRTVQDGVTTPGTVHVTEPALPVRCLFRGPYDVLHLHVPNTLIAECARDMPGSTMPSWIAFRRLAGTFFNVACGSLATNSSSR